MLKKVKRVLSNLCKESMCSQTGNIKQLQHDIKMPKYLYHSPMDYSTESWPPQYEPNAIVKGVKLPIPCPRARPGYSPDDDQFYLEWGKSDHDLICDIIKKHHKRTDNLTILDWGCSSGRVLRHFHEEHKKKGWTLLGSDIQAYLVEWIRQNFPPEFKVITGSTFPHLPYKDNSIDIIYGISVFTHTKYLWDFWLTEFQRVLKPGGLVIQTVQCEEAWSFYHKNNHLDWVKSGHPDVMLSKPTMPQDYFLFGDAFVSQTFFKEAVIKKYWSRVMDVVDFLPPPKGQYQNWIVLKA